MTRRLKIGLSTCPNDTFLFHGLLSGAVQVEGLELDFELLDIEELNEGLLAGRFDVAKGSFALALEEAEQLLVLPTGAALGSGNGPLLLARPGARDRVERPRILAPGEHTTASLLLRLFHGPLLGSADLEQVVFSAIQPALLDGSADLGACIHEGRFTWEAQGLDLIEDLGERWERETGALLPLGGLFARRYVPAEALGRLTQALQASLDHGRAHPEEALETMRRHAQEQTDPVLWSHVELYVTEQTRALDEEGRRALTRLGTLARATGLTKGDGASLEVLPDPSGPTELLHLTTEEGLAELQAGRPLQPASLQSEGFVHLSRPDQLAGTLEAHFRPGRDLVLLDVALPLGAPLAWEPSRGGALFPHLYRALHPSDVRGGWPIQWRGPGSWTPEQLKSQPSASL